jgi:cytidine deaminase
MSKILDIPKHILDVVHDLFVSTKFEMRTMHIAIITRKRKVLILCANTHRRHAEEKAIEQMKFLYGQYKKITTLWVIRIHYDGKISNSKPCSTCTNCLRHSQIKYVCYSNDDGRMTSELTSKLSDGYLSSGNRCINRSRHPISSTY